MAYFIFMLFVSAVNPDKKQIHHSPKPFREYAEIESTDTICALLLSKASDYFIYKGTPIGFQYELLIELGKNLGKTMNITVENDPNIAYEAIFSGQYDIVAIDYKRNPLIDYYLTFSEPHSTSYPVLVGKTGLPKDSMTFTIGIPSRFPIDIEPDLIPGTETMEIFYHEDMTTEDLFDKVQKEEEHYLICDYNEAITLLPFFSDLKVVVPAGQIYDRQWNLNGKNRELNAKINEWLSEFKESSKYEKLCKKYLSPKSAVINHSFKKSGYNRISPYDQIIKKNAEKRGVDWRFVTSIIYQETKFHTDLIGMGGSFGLMQMMPVTGSRYGVDENSTPEEQIIAGIRYICFLEKIYKDIPDDQERLKFIAGAYNSGPGHINDAQRLCEKYGSDPFSWEEVAGYLALKSKSEFVKDPVVKHGYYPGNHTVKYVSQVMDRYEAYSVVVSK